MSDDNRKRPLLAAGTLASFTAWLRSCRHSFLPSNYFTLHFIVRRSPVFIILWRCSQLLLLPFGSRDESNRREMIFFRVYLTLFFARSGALMLPRFFPSHLFLPPRRSPCLRALEHAAVFLKSETRFHIAFSLAPR